MADKEHKEQKIGSHLSGESIRAISESIGIVGLPDDAAGHLAEDCTYRLKQLVQESVKFMQHGKRRKLSTADFDNSLRLKNIEPVYGFQDKDFIPFRYASGGGRELHFTEEKEFDLQEIINSSLPRIPLEVSLRAHWLSIEGIQPSIPENPPPATKDQQKSEILDTAVKTAIDKAPKVKPQTDNVKTKHRHKTADLAKIKDLSTHELSVEQQLYYKEITEACVGSDEGRRSEALQSLASDPGLHQMLPRFSTFISEGVKINVVQNNLALLIYLMRMVKSLMDNQTLYLEKYLHEFVPAVCTCIVSKQLCMRPDVDNHWALRDFAAKLMAQICKNFSTNTNNIQARITKMCSQALHSDKAALATQYGAIAGLGELGSEVIKSFLLPQDLVKSIGDRIKMAVDGPILNNPDKIAGDNIKKLLTKYLPSVLKTLKPPSYSLDDYTTEYGYVGPMLFSAVERERKSSGGSVSSTPNRPTVHIPQARSQIVIQQPGSQPGTPGTPRVSGAITIPRTPVTPSGGHQKFVIMSSQARTSTSASGIGQTVSLSGGSGGTGPTVVKLVTSSQNSSNTPVTPGTPSSGPKIVVVTMPQGGSGSQGQALQSLVSNLSTPSSQDLGVKSVFGLQSSNLPLNLKKDSDNS